MLKQIGSLLALAATLAFPATDALGSQATHAATSVQECIPLVLFYGGVKTCYLPAHLAAAEHRLVPQPVSPGRVVARLTHLPLRQVIVLSGTGTGRPGPAIAVVYVFGTPTAMICPPGSHCPHIPLYVTVQETVGHRAGAGMTVDNNTGNVPGPWRLSANIPGRDLSLDVESNTKSKQLIREIGQGIVRTAT
jgi:hypothetical protein